MLILRSLRVPPLRLLSTTSSAVKRLTRQDVDFVSDPNEKYMEGFMKHAGQHRTAFKREDISTWQSSFGDDYQLLLMCMKGTTQVIATMNRVCFRPINSSNVPAYFLGLGWIDPEVRKKRVAALLSEMSLSSLPGDKSNLVAHINKHSRQFWHMMAKKQEVADRGTDSMVSHYITFYKWSNFLVPESLSFDDITVKNAKQVPKVDMISYDQEIFPFHREQYLITNMHDKDGFGKVAYDENGKVIGMAQAIIYPNGDCNLGPVYGDNPRAVQAMFAEILKDMMASGRTVTKFIVISTQMCSDGFKWIAPFLKCEPHRVHYCNFVYRNSAPKNIDFSKVYSPAHAQLCPV